MSSDWPERTSKSFLALRLPPEEDTGRRVSDRQRILPGWDQERVQGARVVVVGAGGTGTQVLLYLGKLGVKQVHVVDFDPLEVSNLNRVWAQPSDLYDPKGIVVAKRASELCFLGTEFIGHPLYFSEFREENPNLAVDLVVACTDNNESRLEVQEWALERGTPCVHMGIAADGGSGYVFVHEPGGPCLCCLMGEQLFSKTKTPCNGTPVALDILQAVCGHANYAISTLMTQRIRHWNHATTHLATGLTRANRVKQDPDCPLCSSRRASS